MATVIKELIDGKNISSRRERENERNGLEFIRRKDLVKFLVFRRISVKRCRRVNICQPTRIERRVRYEFVEGKRNKLWNSFFSTCKFAISRFTRRFIFVRSLIYTTTSLIENCVIIRSRKEENRKIRWIYLFKRKIWDEQFSTHEFQLLRKKKPELRKLTIDRATSFFEHSFFEKLEKDEQRRERKKDEEEELRECLFDWKAGRRWRIDGQAATGAMIEDATMIAFLFFVWMLVRSQEQENEKEGSRRNSSVRDNSRDSRRNSREAASIGLTSHVDKRRHRPRRHSRRYYVERNKR